jgi:hypothetical protein
MARIPNLEKIVTDARNKLVYGGNLTKEQEALAYLRFYEQLSSTKLARRKDHNLLHIGKESEEEQIYWFDAEGFDITKSLYAFFDIKLITEGEKELSKKVEERFVRYFFSDCFPYNARQAFLKVNAFDNIRPQNLDKFVIGPFYFKGTRNPESLQDVFNEFEQPWLLRFRKENAYSRRSVEMNKGKMELCSDETTEEYALCPHALKRTFEEFFADDYTDFNVIGV